MQGIDHRGLLATGITGWHKVTASDSVPPVPDLRRLPESSRLNHIDRHRLCNRQVMLEIIRGSQAEMAPKG